MEIRSFWQYKVYCLAAYLVAQALGYFIAGYVQFFSVYTIETNIDMRIPYLPWTILVYISYYILLLLAPALCQEKKLFANIMRCYWGVLIVTLLIFIFFPTKYPPNQSEYKDFFTTYFYRPIKALDTDYNACPSLHVSLSVTGAFVFFYYRLYGKASWFLLWGLFVAMSTMTVKQHSIIDVIAGISLSLLIVTIIMRKQRVANSEYFAS